MNCKEPQILKVQYDRVGSLHGVGGFRYDNRAVSQQENITYIQCYSTEKNPTYRPAKLTRYSQASRSLPPRLFFDSQSRYSALEEWLTEEQRLVTAASKLDTGYPARVEIRTPVKHWQEHGERMINMVIDSIYERRLVQFPNASWW